MKRSMGGGTHRGPVAHRRQRRTIRIMQVVLLVIAAALLMSAGYSYGQNAGYRAGRAGDPLDRPGRPSLIETAILGVLGAGVIGAAFSLGGPGRVRIPTPARLEELAGRGDAAVIERSGRREEDPGPES